MKPLRILLALFLLFAGLPSFAQAVGPIGNTQAAGTFYATAYSKWVLYTTTNTPAGASNLTISASYTSLNSSEATLYGPFEKQPFEPLLIDSGANQETITPSSTSGCGFNAPYGACTIASAVVFSFSHGENARIVSGTYGLQDAINAATSIGGGVVVVDQAWQNIGGNTSLITNAKGNTSVSILDNRAAAGGTPTNYVWNGSQYFPAAVATGTVTVNQGNPGCLAAYSATTNIVGDCGFLTDFIGDLTITKSIVVQGTGTPYIMMGQGAVPPLPAANQSGFYMSSKGGMMDCQTTSGADCLRGFNDVRNFGVDCTGVVDSTAAIQSMINSNPDFSKFYFPMNCQALVSTSGGSPVAITIQSRNGLEFWFEGREANGCDIGGSGGAARIIDKSPYVAGSKIFYINQSQRLLFHNMTIESDGSVDVPLDVDQTTNPPISTQNLYENICITNKTNTRNSAFRGIRFSNVGVSNNEMQWVKNASIVCASVTPTSATSNGDAIVYGGNNANQKDEVVDGLAPINCSIGVAASYGSDYTITNLLDSSSWTNFADGTFNSLLSGSRFENANNQITITNALGVKTYIHNDFAVNTPFNIVNCNITLNNGGCSNLTMIGNESDNANDWFNVGQGNNFQGQNSSLFAACNRNLVYVPLDFQLGMFAIPCAASSWYGGRTVLNTFGMWMTPPISPLSIPQNFQSPPLTFESESGSGPLLNPFTLQLVPNGSYGAATNQTFEMVPANPTNGVTHWLAFTGNQSGATMAQIQPGSATGIVQQVGANNGATWTYVICAHGNMGVVCGSPVSTTQGATTLTSSNYNDLQIDSAPGATYYDIYRTVSGGTPSSLGKIGTVAAVAPSQWWTAWAANNIPFLDQGAAGDSTTAPTTNTTGMFAGTEISTPTTFPPANQEWGYYKASVGFCSVDHSGTEHCPGGGGGGSGVGYNGVNSQTASYTAVAGDSGKLVIMNCSSACTFTLFGSPTATYNVSVISIGSTLATVSLNSKNFNGASSVPVLNSFVSQWFGSDGTNYFGPAPLSAGSNVTFTPGSNGLVIASNQTVLSNGTTATTQAANDNSTKVATDQYVDTGTNHTLCSSGAAAAITGNGSPQAIYTCNISAAQFAVGHTFRVQISFIHGTGTTSVSYTWKLGGTTFVAQASNNANLATAEITCTVLATNSEQCIMTPFIFSGGFIGGPQVPTATETTGSSSSLTLQFSVGATDIVTPKAEIGVFF